MIFNQFPQLHKRLVIILSIFVVILMLLPSGKTDNDTSTVRKSIPLSVTPTVNSANKNAQSTLPNAENPIPTIAVIEPESVDGSWSHHVIKKGDSVYRIFRKFKLPSETLHQLIELESNNRSVTRIKTGGKMSFYIADNKLIQLKIIDKDRDATYSLRVDGSYIKH